MGSHGGCLLRKQNSNHEMKLETQNRNRLRFLELQHGIVHMENLKSNHYYEPIKQKQYCFFDNIKKNKKCRKREKILSYYHKAVYLISNAIQISQFDRQGMSIIKVV